MLGNRGVGQKRDDDSSNLTTGLVGARTRSASVGEFRETSPSLSCSVVEGVLVSPKASTVR